MAFESKQKLKKSGLLFSLFLSIIFVLIPYLFKNHINLWPLVISFLILIISLTNPFLLKKPYKAWLKFGEMLSKINSKLVLAIFFYLILSPAAIIRYLIKFLLKRKIKKKSYYNKINKDSITYSFKDQY